jgi:hypothetical protein
MILWGGGTAGPAVPPGRYTVRLTADGQTLTTPVLVRRNPWLTDITDADLAGAVCVLATSPGQGRRGEPGGDRDPTGQGAAGRPAETVG